MKRSVRRRLRAAEHERVQRDVRRGRQRLLEPAAVPAARRRPATSTCWSGRSTTGCSLASRWTARRSSTRTRWSRTASTNGALVRRGVLSRQHHAVPRRRCRATSTRSRETSVYVNLFVGSTADIPLDAGHVRVTQDTRYPWDGDVRLTLAPAAPGRFTLRLRVPGWARNEGVARRSLSVRGHVSRTGDADGERSTRSGDAGPGLRGRDPRLGRTPRRGNSVKE